MIKFICSFNHLVESIFVRRYWCLVYCSWSYCYTVCCWHKKTKCLSLPLHATPLDIFSKQCCRFICLTLKITMLVRNSLLMYSVNQNIVYFHFAHHNYGLLFGWCCASKHFPELISLENHKHIQKKHKSIVMPMCAMAINENILRN